MGHILGADRDQAFITSLEEFVDKDNICRVIDAFIDSLNLIEMGFMYSVPKDTGRPPFCPGDILKLYLYGAQYKVRSSRKLEAETLRNVEVMWLLNGLTPDNRTICKFRKDNRKPLKEVFKMFNRLCIELDLFGKKTAAIDGSKVKANNSRNNHHTQKDAEKKLGKLDKRIEAYLDELDRNDSTESMEPSPDADAINAALKKLNEKKKETEDILNRIKENDGKPLSTVDEDAALMKQGGSKGFDVCHNVQTSVDEKHGMIVDFNVTGKANDMGELSDMVERTKEMLGVDEINILADTGYSNGEELHKSEEAGATCFVPKAKPSHQAKDERYRREKFEYDAGNDCYTCPEGHIMAFVRTRKRDGFKVYANRAACMNCPNKELCTKSKTLREIERNPYEESIQRANQNAMENPELYQRRMELSEHPFGYMKRGIGVTQYLCIGTEMVTAETALAFLSFNLRRAVNILGVKEILEVLEARLTGQKNRINNYFCIPRMELA